MTGPILYSVNLTEQCKYKDLTTINSNQRVKEDHHIEINLWFISD